jgi:hypothetical protein
MRRSHVQRFRELRVGFAELVIGPATLGRTPLAQPTLQKLAMTENYAALVARPPLVPSLLSR